MLCEAGSPLPLEGYEWLYRQVGSDVHLNVGSGGTDVCTGDRAGLPAPAGLRGRDERALSRGRRGRVRSEGRAGGRRARRARDPPADALDAGDVLERSRRLPLPRRLLRAVPRRLALRRLDHVHGARQLRDHRPLGRDAQPRRRPARDERVVRRGRGVRRGARQPRRPPRGDGRPDPLRRPAGRRRAGRSSAGTDHGHSRRASCRRDTGPTRSSPCRGSRGR